MPTLSRALLVSLAIVAAMAVPRAAHAQQSGRPKLGPAMKQYDTPYYTIYTDLPADRVRECGLRMARMYEDYRERTKPYLKGLPGGKVIKLPFYVFADRRDYLAAGAPAKSAGVFVTNAGDAWLMAADYDDGRNDSWSTIQHEAFHQFIHHVIGAAGRPVPVWLNGRLAEYFGEAAFTGDGLLPGLIPPDRVDRVKQGLAGKRRYRSVADLLEVNAFQWTRTMDVAQYDQAWSLAHFLIHGDGGKYREAFDGYVSDVFTRKPAADSWRSRLGDPAAIEKAWRAWWEAMPADPTAELRARATLTAIAGVASRAHAQRRSYPDLTALMKAATSRDLPLDGGDWLPPAFLSKTVVAMALDGGTYSLEPGARGQPPAVVLVRPDGTRLVATLPAQHAVPLRVTITATAAVTSPPLARMPGTTPPPPAATTRPATPWKPAAPTTTGPATPPIASRDPAAPRWPPAPPAPPVAPPPADAGFVPAASQLAGRSPASASAARLVAEQNKWGKPDHALVGDVAKAFDAAAANGRNVTITLGGGLLTSGRVTFVNALDGECFALELSEEQGRHLTLAPMRTQVSEGRPVVRRSPAPAMEIGLPTTADAGPIQIGKKLRIRVPVKRSGGPEDGEYVLRVCYYFEGTWKTAKLPLKARPPADGAPAGMNLDTEELPAASSIMLIFVDLCRTPPGGDAQALEVVSNTAAAVFDVVATP